MLKSQGYNSKKILQIVQMKKNDLVGKIQNYVFERSKCNSNRLHKATVSHNTTTDGLSRHKSISNHIQTRNLQPQYQEPTLESLSSVEYDAPHGHMFEQSEIEQSTKNFDFIPKSPLNLYCGKQ